MAIETKEQMFERLLSKEKPTCPHCQSEMNLWEVPPINFSDGLGWGTPYMFVCFNDECSAYQEGWNNLKENYAHTASYRCAKYPDGDNYEYMPVFSPLGGKGQLIDEEALAAEEVLKENIKKGFSILADCYVEKDGPAVMNLLTDVTQPARVRLKAAEMIGDIGEMEALDPLINLKFGNEILQKQVTESIKKLHAKFFTRECPFCAEIIKQRAKICKHCGKEVAGV